MLGKRSVYKRNLYVIDLIVFVHDDRSMLATAENPEKTPGSKRRQTAAAADTATEEKGAAASSIGRDTW
jgi:hypothetical protein